VNHGNESSLAFSLMQSITPKVIVGGIGTYSFKNSNLTKGFAGIFHDGDHEVTAQLDNQVIHLK
jgi:hypothetical protein